MSLLTSAPHLMMSGVSAIGALCKQTGFAQFNHNQQACRRRSPDLPGFAHKADVIIRHTRTHQRYNFIAPCPHRTSSDTRGR
jgi:hypothetical protein